MSALGRQRCSSASTDGRNCDRLFFAFRSADIRCGFDVGSERVMAALGGRQDVRLIMRAFIYHAIGEIRCYQFFPSDVVERMRRQVWLSLPSSSVTE
jgi:hypothetical protein